MFFVSRDTNVYVHLNNRHKNKYLKTSQECNKIDDSINREKFQIDINSNKIDYKVKNDSFNFINDSNTIPCNIPYSQRRGLRITS